MDTPAHSHTRKVRLPWILFSLGVLITPVAFTISGFLTHDHVDTSFFSRRLFFPLIGVGFCSALAAPFFSALPLARRCLLSFFAALGWGMIGYLSFVAALAVFGK